VSFQKTKLLRACAAQPAHTRELMLHLQAGGRWGRNEAIECRRVVYFNISPSMKPPDSERGRGERARSTPCVVCRTAESPVHRHVGIVAAQEEIAWGHGVAAENDVAEGLLEGGVAPPPPARCLRRIPRSVAFQAAGVQVTSDVVWSSAHYGCW